MKYPAIVLSAFLGLILATVSQGKELADLKVLYVGTEHGGDYASFLKDKVAQVESKARAEFKPQDADGFDVVLFYWPQGEETREMRKLTSPLGARENWKKPTVLLGSAGLNLAVAWKMKGGSGCTCLDPLAYDLRQHEIFERPFAIDRAKAIPIPTPPDFQGEIKESEISVLSLVEDHKRNWKAGWCTYSDDFSRNPDVEFFCGGVNHKTPTAAALWRQGNLLHFGFEQQPSELTENGRKLLLNSIAYISRFSEDRPIAVTPSVFAGPVARRRTTPSKWLRNSEYPLDMAKDLFAPALWEKVSALGGREPMAKWADENGKYLHPNAEQKLEIDEDLLALGVAFDDAQFFDKAFDAIRSGDGAAAARARRLLERYATCGPADADVATWAAWWKQSQPYAFASDYGDYRWYIDTLAQKRGVPSSEMRGPKRAD
jgi:hypothetical protein